MPLKFGLTDYEKPQWEMKIDNAMEYAIAETGLSREQLKNVLKKLHEHGIIN